jgi:glycosyltransferase involved in cell wall biosynthesis
VPEVSVLLPVLNAATTLGRALDSLLGQTFVDFEIIIIANGSDKPTLRIIDAYANQPIVKFIKLESPGLVQALNLGLAAASGAFIARMDADDYAYPQRLERQCAYLHDHPEIGVVSSLVQHVATAENQTGYQIHVEQINQIITPQDHEVKRFIDAPLANPSVLFRKSLIDQFGEYLDFDGPEDYELWLRFLDQGVAFAKINEVLLDWYDYPQRLTRTAAAYNTDRFYQLKADYFAKWWQRHQEGRSLYVWGYGKQVFRKVMFLEENKIAIAGYIDVKHRTSTKRHCLHHTAYNKDLGFVLIYVSDRKGKTLINDYLLLHGAVEGTDYLFMS